MKTINGFDFPISYSTILCEKLIELSSKLSNKFDYLYITDFEDKENTKHYMFNIDLFYVWVLVIDGIVKGVVGSDESDLSQFEDEKYENVSEEQFIVHNQDIEILNLPENITLLQELITYLK